MNLDERDKLKSFEKFLLTAAHFFFNFVFDTFHV